MRTLARGGLRVFGFVLAVLLIPLGTIGFIFAFARGAAIDAEVVSIGLVCVGLVLGRRSLSGDSGARPLEAGRRPEHEAKE